MKKSTKKYLFLLWLVLVSAPVFGQKDTTKNDTISSVNQKGFTGQVRYFFMATDNQHPLTDYNAHALSAQAKYEKGFGKNFRAVASGSVVYNLSSGDLAKTDTVAKRSNRYEVGLFDLRYPSRKTNYRLEELYLQYRIKNGFMRLGSQLINTPFINPQDGRMRPTFVSGLYTNVSMPSTQLEGGWIGGILPRSISSWYNVASSIGLNPQGVNADGKASNYEGHLSSKGIFLAGITHSLTPAVKIKFWEQYVDNLFNTILLQADVESQLNSEAKLVTSLQYTHQSKVHNGGNSDVSKTYFASENTAHVISAMHGIKWQRFDGSFNYTRVFKNARFLMPREWGREPFFTFMPRERNEGFGDVQAFVIKTAYSFPKAGLKTFVQAGIFKLPDVKNTTLNKYGMPSYSQLNAEMRYTPKFAKQFDLQLLYVYKHARGNTYQNPAYVFNKVNMSLYNLVLNYNW